MTVTLVHYLTFSDIQILYTLGLREFGENRDQEASIKAKALPKDINWHFQGGIQSNKLKSICNWASVIHSVDQFKYAQIISEQPSEKPRQIFIQVSLDQPPESRGGVNPEKLLELASRISLLSNIKILGLMAVGPVNQAAVQVKQAELQLEQAKIQLDQAQTQQRQQDNVQRELLKQDRLDDRQAAELQVKLITNREDNETAKQIAAMETITGEKVGVSTGTGINP